MNAAAAQTEALHVAGDAWRAAQAAQAESLQSMQTSVFKCAALRLYTPSRQCSAVCRTAARFSEVQ